MVSEGYQLLDNGCLGTQFANVIRRNPIGSQIFLVIGELVSVRILVSGQDIVFRGVEAENTLPSVQHPVPVRIRVRGVGPADGV